MVEEKDDEISIDLSKIKGFFKRKKQEVEKHSEVHADIKNDVNKTQETDINDASEKKIEHTLNESQIPS